MEPPGEGRYESAAAICSRSSTSPQWSRPVKGGTSCGAGPKPAPHPVPQWSRPVKGGTSKQCIGEIFCLGAAAMEPPGEGRYEPTTDTKTLHPPHTPQWSRPVKGGTSPLGGMADVLGPAHAAMEPPGEGRYEAPREPRHQVQGRAAMEPPGEGRYELLLLRRVRRLSPAAMEPPGEGRYEPHRFAAAHLGCRAAMEPPGEGRYERKAAVTRRPRRSGRNGAAR